MNLFGVALVLAWAGVLAWVLWKAHAERQARFASTLGDGLEALELADSAPAEAGDPDGAGLSNSVLRTVFAWLLVAAAASLALAGVTRQRSWLAAHLVFDNCFLVYVGFLVVRRDARARQQAVDERPTLVGDEVVREPWPIADEHPGGAAGAQAPGVPVIAAPMAGRLLGVPVAPAS